MDELSGIERTIKKRILLIKSERVDFKNCLRE